jgi:amidohydrolase
MLKKLSKKSAILLVLLLFFTTANYAQTKKSKSVSESIDYIKLKQLAYADSSRLVEIFKDIHQHPETAFTETRTAAIISKEFEGLGYTVITGIGKTGVVGILKNGEGPTVMYRADMDALPVKEATGLSYSSVVVAKNNDGTETPVMHACGHDAHITWMLGAAKIMIALKSSWKGTLVFLAQPAEEPITGADAMVKDKLYERGVPLPDYLLGMHSKPFPVGVVENCAGVRMAGTDQFDITFHGIGGHGSVPHLAKDPVIMAATAILDYQAIVNRSISVQSPHVITVGSIVAGAVNNIIPNSAVLKVNLRWFTEADRNAMINGIKKVDSSIAFANNLPAELYPTTFMKSMSYPVKNDTAMVNKINKAFGNFLPAGKLITDYPPVMASEDFPLLIVNSKKNPVYDFMFVGIANPELYMAAVKEGKEFPFYYHTPYYTVDLEAIPFGTVIGAAALIELFRK